MKSRNWKVYASILLPIQMAIFAWLSQKPDFIEGFYIKYLFQNLTSVLRQITGWFDFSVGLILMYCLVVFAIISLVVIFSKIIKGQLKPYGAFIKIATAISIIYFFYMITWGLAYFRMPVASITKVNFENIRDEEIVSLAQILIQKTNEARQKISTQEARSNEITSFFTQAPIGFNNISKETPAFIYEHPSIKIGFNKAILSYLSTGGIYSFPTGEANINANNSAFEAPFTICHEMAHQLGFASEEEANYVSFLSCMNNPQPIFKYSAYSEAMTYILNNILQQDSLLYSKLKAEIDTTVLNDFAFSRNKWKPYQIPWLKKISNYIYDIFLKSNQQDAGIKSYGLVVELLIGEMRKNNIHLQIKNHKKFETH